MKNIYFLENKKMNYDWGGRTAIPELLGTPSPSPKPVAELWMGAHPKAPSEIGIDGNKTNLIAFISQNPEKILGAAVSRRFSGKLPFLFKVLSAERPLSVQAHPDESMALKGFEKENIRGLALDDPRRNFKDDRSKPECICALSPFIALCGFRKPSEMLSFLKPVLSPAFSDLLPPLENAADSSGSRRQNELKRFFKNFLRIKDEKKKELIEHAAEAAKEKAENNDVYDWMAKIHASLHAPAKEGRKRPEPRFDLGVFAPLILNLVELEPGQALYLPPGRLHSYLQGLGIELMGASDNVVRCALTTKHVDPEELLKVVRFDSQDLRVLEPLPLRNAERYYETPASEFVLSFLKTGDGTFYESPVDRSVEIMLCTGGNCRFSFETGDGAEVEKGDSVLVPASAAPYRIDGVAELFKAGVPL